MLSAVAKAYVVVAALLAAFAVVYIDPLNLGPGGGGDHLGGTLLLGGAIVAVALAVATSFRAITSTDVERPTPADAPAPSLHPADQVGPAATRPSPWPPLLAGGLLFLGLAAAFGSVFAYVGVGLAAIAALAWLAQSWAEHPLVTRRLADRVGTRTVGPLTYPLTAIGLGVVVAVAVSRIYLTITETAAVIVSMVVATVLFLGALVLASGRNVGRRLTTGLAGVALVSIVGAGVASAARGERIVEFHEPGFTELDLRAEGIAYERTELALKEGKISFTFVNADPAGTYHNVGVYSAREGGEPFASFLPIDGGTKKTQIIDTKASGLEVGRSYVFRCDFHPAMVGTLAVEPAPAKAEHGGGDTHGAGEGGNDSEDHD